MRAQPRAQGRKAARDKGGQVRLRQHNREQRATEQAEARQARLAQNREANRRRRQAGRQSEPEQTSMPVVQDEWVQGKLDTFHAKSLSL